MTYYDLLFSSPCYLAITNVVMANIDAWLYLHLFFIIKKYRSNMQPWTMANSK